MKERIGGPFYETPCSFQLAPKRNWRPDGRLHVLRVCRRDQSYIGQIDLEDIRVICNRAVTSLGGGDWSTNTEDSRSGVVVNAPTLDMLHRQKQSQA